MSAPIARGTTLSCARARACVAWLAARRWLGGLHRRPLALGGALAVLAAVVWLQWRGPAPAVGGAVGRAVGRGGAQDASRFAALALALLLMTWTRTSPLRLRVADVSWLLTAPGGGRMLVLRHLLGAPILVATTLAVLGTAGAAWHGAAASGLLVQALGVGVVTATLRLLSSGRHLLALRAPRVASWLRALAAAWAVLLVVSLGTGWLARSWLWLDPVVSMLARSILAPDAGQAAGLAALAAVVVAGAGYAARAARGFEAPAETTARQFAQAEARLATGRAGGGSASDLRTGTVSLPYPALPGAGPAAAVLYRATAHYRRAVLGDVQAMAALIAVLVGAALLAPRLVPFLAAFALINTLSAVLADGLGADLDHDHVHLMAASARLVVLASTVVPAVRLTGLAEILALPVLAARPGGWALWPATAVLIPFAALAAVSAAAPASVLFRPFWAQLAGCVALTGLAAAPAVLGVAGIGAGPAGVAVAAVSLTLAASVLALAAGYLLRARSGRPPSGGAVRRPQDRRPDPGRRPAAEGAS